MDEAVKELQVNKNFKTLLVKLHAYNYISRSNYPDRQPTDRHFKGDFFAK